MRFDWYQATVAAHPVELAELLKRELTRGRGVIQSGKGRFNYLQSLTVLDPEGDKRAVILAGGPNGDPNVTFSGEVTPDGVAALRGAFPSHRVTRFDAAEDFVAENAWETLETVCRSVATECQVKGRAVVPDDVAEGRTYYMGAPTSDVRVRLYEKTAQMRKALPSSRWSDVPDGWNRLEVQVRPKHRMAKEMGSQLEPSQIWGFAEWTAELAKRAMDLQVERLHTQIRRETDDERAIRVMCQQYAKVLGRLHSDLGDWSCVGLTIGEIVSKLSAR